MEKAVDVNQLSFEQEHFAGLAEISGFDTAEMTLLIHVYSRKAVP